MEKVEIFRINTEQSLKRYCLVCLSNQKHPGFQSKLNWLKKEFKIRFIFYPILAFGDAQYQAQKQIYLT